MRKWLAALAAIAALCAILWTLRTLPAPPQAAAISAAPDLAGVWRRARVPPDNARQYTYAEMVGYIGEIPPMTAWGEAKYKAAKPNAGPRGVAWSQSNDPQGQCFPPGVPRIYSTRVGSPFEIFQVPGRVIMFFEYDHLIRQIYVDGRAHSSESVPSWMGDSIGKWDGETLVVDTANFNDKSWLDAGGHPHSDALHLVERIRRVSHDAMNIDMTFDDPKAYTKPWSAHTVFELKPDWNIGEVVCADQANFNDTEKLLETSK